MRELHIIAGLLSILAGALALLARKGGPLHRQGGLVFVAAMVTMTVTAFISSRWLRVNLVNSLAASLTFYLVVSGWLAIQRRWVLRPVWTVGLLLPGLAAGIGAALVAADLLRHPSHRADGVPAEPLVLFASVALLAVLGDLRELRRPATDRIVRLSRHLWRMTFAMWIATTSLFLGQTRFFPEALRNTLLLALPVLWVTGTLIYWLLKMARQRWWRLAPKAGRRTEVETTA
jgi:uncharacterized membrane protein